MILISSVTSENPDFSILWETLNLIAVSNWVFKGNIGLNKSHFLCSFSPHQSKGSELESMCSIPNLTLSTDSSPGDVIFWIHGILSSLPSASTRHPYFSDPTGRIKDRSPAPGVPFIRCSYRSLTKAVSHYKGWEHVSVIGNRNFKLWRAGRGEQNFKKSIHEAVKLLAMF